MKIKELLSRDNSDGYPIILTTDRTLASDYNGSEFIGFGSTFPKIIPTPLYTPLFSPSVSHNKGILKFAHCGTRKIEASLLENGFSKDDVIVAHPDHLSRMIGPETKVLGITTHDPLGIGPASSTFSSLVGGEPYSAVFFKRLTCNPLLRRHGVKTVVGGPGTWQLDDPRIMKKYNIDTIVIGEGEKVAPEIFENIAEGKELPKRVDGGVVDVKDMPIIKGATINGLVEISRGCGRGCDFCIPTLKKLRHRPVADILEEGKLNLEWGNQSILLHAEDALRYGAKKIEPKPEKLMKLLKSIGRYTKNIDFSHAALASIVSKPEMIREITQFLNIGSKEKPWFSCQIGIETGSPRLASKHLRGKAKPFDVDNWPSIVKEAFGVMKDNHWVPCTTLIMGLPGEDADDVMKTMELLDELEDHKFFVVPLMYVPLGVSRNTDFFSMEDMLAEHWQLLAKCIEKDLDVAPDLIKEMAKINNISNVRKYSYLLLKWIMENRLDTYIKIMKEGINPLTVKYGKR